VSSSGVLRGRLGGRRVAAQLANRPPQLFRIFGRVATLTPAPARP
jgi:hypothetical protein